MLEVSLYSVAKSKSLDERDDPLEAFLCFHPPDTPKKSLMVKLHYLSLHRATKDLFSSDKTQEISTIKTSKKVTVFENSDEILTFVVTSRR